MSLEEKLRKILNSSKRYEFKYGVNGMTVLSIQDYYTGEEIKLDLSVLLDHEDILEEMIELAEEGDEE